MSSITFDTLKYIKTLESAGVPRPQAEAQVAAQREALAESIRSQYGWHSDQS